MDLGIRDRVALVTGASAGIGFAVARSLVREGARVAICSRDRDRIETAARSLRDEGDAEILPIVGDVSHADGPERIVAETVERLGGLQILVTNAGGPRSGNFSDVRDEDFDRAIAQTFRSVDRLIRAARPHLERAGWGRIVNLTSITAKEPHDGLLLSNALRPAVHGLSKSLARELGGRGITVNCVCPGYTDTERLQELADAAAGRRSSTAEAVYGAWKANIPRGELGRPEEIGDVVAFLCSNRASFVNGVSLAVDGGESHGLL
jgi:3-oxoacyl-[acyl-carrier protein] reductase